MNLFGHELIYYENEYGKAIQEYTCKLCNNKFWVLDGILYYFDPVDCWVVALKCDEMIIKSIIE